MRKYYLQNCYRRSGRIRLPYEAVRRPQDQRMASSVIIQRVPTEFLLSVEIIMRIELFFGFGHYIAHTNFICKIRHGGQFVIRLWLNPGYCPDKHPSPTSGLSSQASWGLQVTAAQGTVPVQTGPIGSIVNGRIPRPDAVGCLLLADVMSSWFQSAAMHLSSSHPTILRMYCQNDYTHARLFASTASNCNDGVALG